MIPTVFDPNWRQARPEQPPKSSCRSSCPEQSVFDCRFHPSSAISHTSVHYETLVHQQQLLSLHWKFNLFQASCLTKVINVIRQDGKVHRYFPLLLFIRSYNEDLHINRIVPLERRNKYTGRNVRKVILLQGFGLSYINFNIEPRPQSFLKDIKILSISKQ